MSALDLVLNVDGVDGEPSRQIKRFVFEQVLFQANGRKGWRVDRREIDHFFLMNSRLGASIEIDTDEGDSFGSIYISVSEKNPDEAAPQALAVAGFLARELGLKAINPLEGIQYDLKSLPEFG